jgi:hypothetical protein
MRISISAAIPFDLIEKGVKGPAPLMETSVPKPLTNSLYD